MTRITRKAIRVNRTATCWLIRRFLDSEAEFLFVRYGGRAKWVKGNEAECCNNGGS